MKNLEWYAFGAFVLAVWYLSPKKISDKDATVVPTEARAPKDVVRATNVSGAPPPAVNTIAAGVYVPPASPPTNEVTPLPNAKGVTPYRPPSNIPY